jgi:hypothetical protein
VPPSLNFLQLDFVKPSSGFHPVTWERVKGDSQLLVVGSQIGNLTPRPSLNHNLCFNYPNGSCEPILDIYVPRAFRWYKELLNSMGFDLCDHSLKIWESIGTLTPKVGTHLVVWRFIPSHSPTLPGTWNVTLRLHFWPAPSQALALVTSPRLGLRHNLCKKTMTLQNKWLLIMCGLVR